MPGRTRRPIEPRRVGHKSTGGTLYSIPEPVDPVGNAPSLTFNTVALASHFTRELSNTALVNFALRRRTQVNAGG